jgi:hypothetical protein
MENPVSGKALYCPSAQPDMQDARVLGVVTGSADAPRIAYLKADADVGGAMMEKLGSLDPTHVFRFSAKCEEHRCGQFKDGRCGLGKRIAAGLDPVVSTLPPCLIRSTCRWHAEEGDSICYRCPQVVTLVAEGSARLNKVAAPPP